MKITARVSDSGAAHTLDVATDGRRRPLAVSRYWFAAIVWVTPRVDGIAAAFTVTAVSAGVVAASLRIAWNPPIRTYVEYVPIGTVLASLVWDRLVRTWPRSVRPVLCDAAVVGLALIRVFVPPLPFVSGHTLLSAYAVLTARRWPLRLVASVALVEVIYTKLFAGGGWLSLAGGLAAAATIAVLRRPGRRQESSAVTPHCPEPPRLKRSTLLEKEPRERVL